MLIGWLLFCYLLAVEWNIFPGFPWRCTPDRCSWQQNPPSSARRTSEVAPATFLWKVLPDSTTWLMRGKQSWFLQAVRGRGWGWGWGFWPLLCSVDSVRRLGAEHKVIVDDPDHIDQGRADTRHKHSAQLGETGPYIRSQKGGHAKLRWKHSCYNPTASQRPTWICAPYSINKQSENRRMWFPDNPNMALTEAWLSFSEINHRTFSCVLQMVTHPALPWRSHWLVLALVASVSTRLQWPRHRCGVLEWPALPVCEWLTV